MGQDAYSDDDDEDDVKIRPATTAERTTDGTDFEPGNLYHKSQVPPGAAVLDD